MSHVAHVKRLLARPTAVTVFDLETTDRPRGIHKSTSPGGERVHPLRYPAGKAPRWVVERLGGEEPASGWAVPTGKVMQLAARRYDWTPATGTGVLRSEMNVLFNDPDILDCCLAPSAAATHGITIERTRREGIAPTAAWKQFLALAEGSVLMGQNIIDFDIPFANSELARHRVASKLEPAAAADVLLLAREIWSLRNNRLRTLADFFGVTTDPALDHDALGDIDTCWQVWEAMQPALVEHIKRFVPSGSFPAYQYRGRLGKLGRAWPAPSADALIPQDGPALPLSRDGTPSVE